MQVIDAASLRPAKADRALDSLLGSACEAELRADVAALAYPRHFSAEAAANARACAWIADAFASNGYAVSLSGPFRNIVATLPGCPPGPRILVGSHYDTVPATPGADDNASAVAVSLACARALAALPSPPPVMFVSFNREEDGLLGSQEFVSHYVPAMAHPIRVAHVLEMVGYCSHLSGSQQLPRGLPIRAPNVGDFLGLLTNRSSNRLVRPLLRLARTHVDDLHVLGVKVFFGFEKRFPHLLRSDHAPFWQAKIPAIMWTDTSEFRNPHYHQPSDRPETLDYRFMRQVTQLLLATIVSS